MVWLAATEEREVLFRIKISQLGFFLTETVRVTDWLTALLCDSYPLLCVWVGALETAQPKKINFELTIFKQRFRYLSTEYCKI